MTYIYVANVCIWLTRRLFGYPIIWMGNCLLVGWQGIIFFWKRSLHELWYDIYKYANVLQTLAYLFFYLIYKQYTQNSPQINSLFLFSFSFACVLLVRVYCLLSAYSFILVHLQFFCWSKGRKTGLVLFTKALKREPGEFFWSPFMLVSCLATVLSKVNHNGRLILYFTCHKLTSSVWRQHKVSWSSEVWLKCKTCILSME